MASRMPFWVPFWMPFWMPFWVPFWRLFRTAFWVPFWVPSPEGSFLEANRTIGGCSAHRVPLKTHSVPQEPVFCTEYLFRTVEACFLHRMLPKMRRVPQEAFLSTARIFRTVKACFWYRVLTLKQVAATAEPGVHFSRHLYCDGCARRGICRTRCFP